MTTLRAAARAARDRLLAAAAAKDPIEAEIEAEVLLRHAIDPCGGFTKSRLYARYGDEIERSAADRLESLLTRRLAREPAAYITGRREFYGLDFRVTAEVLIPRPETEYLVECAIELAQAARSPSPLRVADVGTGSGAIAVALAKALPGAAVCAMDVSRPALGVAADNARRHGVEGRIAFRAGDLLTPLEDYVDLIVANLPYVPTADWRRLEPEIREHEPRLALDGGSDGMALIRRLLLQAPRYLRRGGSVLLEVGEGQAEVLQASISDGFPSLPGSEVRADFRGVSRILILR